MNFTEINPFVRYVHYIPVNTNSKYLTTIPYDNRIFYVHKGTGKIKTQHEIHTMEQGDILIIPSGKKYQILPQNCIYVAINFDYTQKNLETKSPIPPAEASVYNPKFNLDTPNFSDIREFNDIICIKNMNDFSGILIRLEQEYSDKLLYSENICSKILSDILFQCARNINEKKYNSNKEITRIILGYINENYNTPLSNQSIGKMFNMHPNYINRLIKISTGMALHQYIIKTRVTKSIELINQKKFSISEIAEMCGFCDIYHYSKIFKKIMGVSPSDYNKKGL